MVAAMGAGGPGCHDGEMLARSGLDVHFIACGEVRIRSQREDAG